MNRRSVRIVLITLLFAMFGTHAGAESRRDGGDAQASKKAQYMLKMLHKEKQELQAKLATLQADHDKLSKEHEKVTGKLEKSSDSNEQLLSRLKDTTGKYKELAGKYRDSISVLRKANRDNQHMVRAVQEREKWISICSDRNGELYDANADLLQRYGKVAKSKELSVFGTGIVELENEIQDYEFKLEDLQVTKYKPAVDIAAHTRDNNEGIPADEEESTNIN